MESMESATQAAGKKSVINQMSTHIWNLFAKTNLFALCCVGAFLSLVCIHICFFSHIFLFFASRSSILFQRMERNMQKHRDHSFMRP